MAEYNPPEVKEKLEQLVETTKKGFDLTERLKNRGLRRGSIVLFLDDDKGAELGWARDAKNAIGEVTGRERVGVLGLLDAAEEVRSAKGTTTDKDAKALDKKVAELEKKRDDLVDELTKTAITIQARAVPPVIQKDCRRKAKATLGITDKVIPERQVEEFDKSHTAHLMTVMVQSVRDNLTGEVNEGLSYQDAIDMIDYLSAPQFERLDLLMGELQFTDAISESIESQEDFS